MPPPPLRGSSSQSYSQYNGSNKGYSSTTYSSGSTGEIQGDAMRWFTSYSSATQEMSENLNWTNVTGRTAESIYPEVAPVGWANALSDSNMSTPFNAGATYFSLEGLFRYRLVGSGEDVSLEEYWDDTVHPSTKNDYNRQRYRW